MKLRGVDLIGKFKLTRDVLTYQLSRSSESIDEGSVVTITLNTTGVNNGVSVPYTITGLTSADLGGAPLTGNFVMVGTQASATATIQFTISADSLTEGSETLTVTLDNNQATTSISINDTSTFDPYYSNVMMLLNGDQQPNGSKYFEDATGRVGIERRGPDVYNSTAQKKFGSGSIYFPGVAGTNIVSYFTPAQYLGTSDFTVEFWMYPTSVTGLQVLYNMPNLRLNGTQIQSTFGSFHSSAAGAISINQWHHVAFTRSSTGTVIYVNGVSVASVTSAPINATISAYGFLGADSNGTNPFKGYIDDFRITKGIVRYTGNFSVPTQAHQYIYTTPTFALSKSVTSVNEGSSVTFTLNTTNVPNDTRIAYTITGVSTGDLVSGVLTGLFRVINNTSSVVLTLRSDLVTEGVENLTLSLDDLSTSAVVAVNDTSNDQFYNNTVTFMRLDSGTLADESYANLTYTNANPSMITIETDGTNKWLKFNNTSGFGTGGYRTDTYLYAMLPAPVDLAVTPYTVEYTFVTNDNYRTWPVCFDNTTDINKILSIGLYNGHPIVGNGYVNPIVGTQHTYGNGTTYKMAVTFDGTTTRMFRDGVLMFTSTTTMSSTIVDRILMGKSGGNYPVGFDGLLDNVRITIGACRYTTNYTPPF